MWLTAGRIVEVDGGVAHLDRAPGYGPGSGRFKSCRPYQYGRIAQLVERLSDTQEAHLGIRGFKSLFSHQVRIVGMNTNQKGRLAVLKVEERAMEKGWISSTPSVETVYDLILDDGKRLYRVQVKYADGSSGRETGAVSVGLEKREGASRFRHGTYSRRDIDAVLAYIPKIDKVLWIGPERFEGKRNIWIRVSRPKNNQSLGLNRAEDFEW